MAASAAMAAREQKERGGRGGHTSFLLGHKSDWTKERRLVFAGPSRMRGEQRPNARSGAASALVFPARALSSRRRRNRRADGRNYFHNGVVTNFLWFVLVPKVHDRKKLFLFSFSPTSKAVKGGKEEEKRGVSAALPSLPLPPLMTLKCLFECLNFWWAAAALVRRGRERVIKACKFDSQSMQQRRQERKERKGG